MGFKFIQQATVLHGDKKPAEFSVTRFRELGRAFIHDLGEILRNPYVIKQSLNVLREFIPNRN